MVGVQIIGPVYGATGYDRHTREFTRQLAALGVAVHLTPLQGWSTEIAGLQQDPLLAALQRPILTEMALHFAMPEHCWPLAEKRNVNYTMFEADRIPAAWAARAAEIDLTVVPTEACAQAWERSGVDASRLRISPLGVDGEFFAQPVGPLQLKVVPPTGGAHRPLASYGKRFLNVAELRPRKNLLGLLRCWLRATSAEDDAVLVLKTTSFHEHDLRAFQEDVATLQYQIGRSVQEAAPIVMLHGSMPDGQLRALYHAATHYISMSFGEGWDLAMMEAAASGLELIAPDHTGYRTYLTAEDATLLPVTLVPAEFEGTSGSVDRMFFAGMQWWRPDEDAAVAAIQAAIRGDSPRRSPAERIVREYTWSKAAKKLLAILEDVTKT